MAEIFISYSHKNLSTMQRVKTEIEAAGFSVWVDDDINPGKQWPIEIDQSIRGASIMVAILSPAAQKSEWVNKELMLARILDMEIFPLLCEGDEKNSLPFLLVDTNYIDFRQSFEAGLEELTRRLYDVRDKIKTRPSELWASKEYHTEFQSLLSKIERYPYALVLSSAHQNRTDNFTTAKIINLIEHSIVQIEGDDSFIARLRDDPAFFEQYSFVFLGYPDYDPVFVDIMESMVELKRYTAKFDRAGEKKPIRERDHYAILPIHQGVSLEYKDLDNSLDNYGLTSIRYLARADFVEAETKGYGEGVTANWNPKNDQEVNIAGARHA